MFFKPKKVEIIDPYQNFPDAVMMIDAHGDIVYVNSKSCFLFGHESETLLSGNIFLIIDNGLEIIKKVSQDDNPVITKVNPVSEIDLYVEVSSTYLEDDDTYLITYRDVTQNHRVVSKLLVEFENAKKFVKEKNSFLSKLTNKVKSPLHSIVGFSQALLDKLGGALTDKQDKYLNIINKNSKDIMLLLDKVFELSKIESGLYEYEFKNFDFITIMNSVLLQSKNEVALKRLQIEVDTSGLVRRNCYGDEAVTKNILTSLIENAIASSTEQGVITIKIENPPIEFVKELNLEMHSNANEKSFVMFRITDAGGGFTEEEVAYVFEPYALLDKNSNKNVLKNICLAISKHLIRHLKGKIWLESKPLKGATFSFIIPIEKFEK